MTRLYRVKECSRRNACSIDLSCCEFCQIFWVRVKTTYKLSLAVAFFVDYVVAVFVFILKLHIHYLLGTFTALLLSSPPLCFSSTLSFTVLAFIVDVDCP